MTNQYSATPTDARSKNLKAQYLSTVPAKYRGIAERALSGSGSKSNAIKAKCLDCSGYVRADVEQCRVVLCPLQEFRPRYEGVRGPGATGLFTDADC